VLDMELASRKGRKKNLTVLIADKRNSVQLVLHNCIYVRSEYIAASRIAMTMTPLGLGELEEIRLISRDTSGRRDCASASPRLDPRRSGPKRPSGP
jgi:hypothetical protein